MLHQTSITALIVMLDDLLLLRASSEFENTALFERRTTNFRPQISQGQRCLSRHSSVEIHGYNEGSQPTL